MSSVCHNKPITIQGFGAVSPAGWTAGQLVTRVLEGEALPYEEAPREGRDRPSRILRVPKAESRQEFARHPRLRRASPISRYLAAAALEALGESRAEAVREGDLRLGIIVVFATGCVSYTRRFYEEVLEDPALASPILFPETVFNAPASHLAAILGSTGINYTLLGDNAEYLSGLRLACDWLHTNQCDGCLVIGAEEIDWLISEAVELFARDAILAEGAGALYLESTPQPASEAVCISQITDPVLYTQGENNKLAPQKTRTLLNVDAASEDKTILLDSQQGIQHLDEAEANAWDSWSGPRLSVRRILGDPPGASTAWQSVCAASLLSEKHQQCDTALISAVGMNQQCMAAELSTRVSSAKKA